MTRIVDCSHTIEHDMITYPGLPGPTIGEHLTRADSRSHYSPGTEFSIGTITMVANTGTYLDTPFHRYADGHDLAGLPIERVVDLPGVCIATDEAAIGAGALVDVDVSGKAVLLYTGWDRHWRTEHYGAAGHPYIADDAIDILVERRAALVGIDSVNIDNTTGGDRPAHTKLLGAGIPVVEHLTNLESLAGQSFRFFAVPPKISELGTFPVRAFAIVT